MNAARRLHIENRLRELNAKYGPVPPLEDWGESYFAQLRADSVKIEAPAAQTSPVAQRGGICSDAS